MPPQALNVETIPMQLIKEKRKYFYLLLQVSNRNNEKM